MTDHKHIYSELTLEPVLGLRDGKTPWQKMALLGYRCRHWENNEQCPAIDPFFYGTRAEAEQKYKEKIDGL